MLKRALPHLRRAWLRAKLASAQFDVDVLRCEMASAPERLRVTCDHVEQLRKKLRELE